MTPRPVIVSPEAEADIDALTDRLIAKAGHERARVWSGRIIAQLERLAHFPDSGASRPRLGKSFRIVVVWPFVMIYRSDEDAVRLLRVVHGRRKITRRLLRKDR